MVVIAHHTYFFLILPCLNCCPPFETTRMHIHGKEVTLQLLHKNQYASNCFTEYY